MPEGAPPPWLIHMQRYGPPPSYPNLKVPGLNAPIPPGASYGYHPGGWGKPPVDEFNRPLYGDVFGATGGGGGGGVPSPPPAPVAPIERNHWGELEDEPEQEEEEEEEEEQEQEGEAEGIPSEGMETPLTTDGISSVPSGLETPDTIDLRKTRKDTGATDDDEEGGAKQLYTVLEQTSAKVGSAAYGSSHKYVLPTTEKEKKEGKGNKDKVDLMKSQKTEKVSITLNPAEVEEMDTLSDDLLKKKYEQYLQEKADSEKAEDVSDIVAEQNRKRKKAAGGKGAAPAADKSKKYKDFKF